MYQPRQAVKMSSQEFGVPCTPEKFAGSLLHSITAVHMLHLVSRSYSQHMALGELYETLPDMIDDLVEVYQGITNTILNYSTEQFTVPKDPVNYVCWLQTYIKDNRSCMGMDSEVQNLIDEIAAEVDRTCYKLNFLS